MMSNINSKLEISLDELFQNMNEWAHLVQSEQSAELANAIDNEAEEISTALNDFIRGVECVAINGVNIYGVEAIGLDTESFSDDERSDIGMYFKKNGETVALVVIQQAVENKITAEKRLNGDLVVMKSIECD